MITPPEIVTTTEQPAATIHLVIPCQDMGRYMDPAIQEVLKALEAQGMRPAGPMFSLHNRRPTDHFDFEIGFPVEKAITPTGRVKNSKLPAMKVVRTVYHGPYDGLVGAWRALEAWVKQEKLPHGIELGDQLSFVKMKKQAATIPTDREIVSFETAQAFDTWLEQHGSTSSGIYIRIAKKDSGIPSVSYAEAVEIALCHG